MTVSWRAFGALLGAFALMVAAACGATGTAPGGGPSGQLRIVVGVYPFQFLAQRIAGPHAQVENLTKPGAEPHDLELTPRQVASVSDANLVIYERTFQAAVDDAVMQSGNKNVLDIRTVVPLEDHGPLGDQPNHRDHEGNANLDPHVWLDPQHMITISKAIAGKLDAIDPTHRTAYDRNADALIRQLEGLDADYRSGLRDCRRTTFITTHAAFEYLAERYGLTQVSISGLSPDTEPSPARIAEVQKLAKEHGVTTIFSETLVSSSVAQSIAGDLGLRTDVLDPIEGITRQSRGNNYLAVMRSNLTALKRANGCS